MQVRGLFWGSGGSDRTGKEVVEQETKVRRPLNSGGRSDQEAELVSEWAARVARWVRGRRDRRWRAGHGDDGEAGRGEVDDVGR